MIYADLHVHTKASDGLLTLEEVVGEARKKKIEVLGITEHDSLNPKLKERWQTINGVEVVTGTEIKAIHKGTKIEILCYFVDPKDNELDGIFKEIQENRIRRMEKMVDGFNRMDTGVKLTVEDVLEVADGPVGRPHFSRAIALKGLTETTREAFDKYAKEGSECYFSIDRPGSSKVIEKAKKSGAFTSLAHPCTEDIENIDSFLEELVSQGLDGCEVNYPYRASPKTLKLDPRDVEETVERLGLIKTGGSDFHNRTGFTLGSGGVTKDVLDDMKRRVAQ